MVCVCVCGVSVRCVCAQYGWGIVYKMLEDQKTPKNIFDLEKKINYGCLNILTLWTPRVYSKSPPTTPNCLRVRQPYSQIVFTSVEQSV